MRRFFSLSIAVSVLKSPALRGPLFMAECATPPTSSHSVSVVKASAISGRKNARTGMVGGYVGGTDGSELGSSWMRKTAGEGGMPTTTTARYLSEMNAQCVNVPRASYQIDVSEWSGFGANGQKYAIPYSFRYALQSSSCISQVCGRERTPIPGG